MWGVRGAAGPPGVAPLQTLEQAQERKERLMEASLAAESAAAEARRALEAQNEEISRLEQLVRAGRTVRFCARVVRTPPAVSDAPSCTGQQTPEPSETSGWLTGRVCMSPRHHHTHRAHHPCAGVCSSSLYSWSCLFLWPTTELI